MRGGVHCQGELTHENYERDHRPRCFTVWFAGSGIESGDFAGGGPHAADLQVPGAAFPVDGCCGGGYGEVVGVAGRAMGPFGRDLVRTKAKCPASTTFPGQRQLFFPTGDNYSLCITLPPFYTGADRGRG